MARYVTLFMLKVNNSSALDGLHQESAGGGIGDESAVVGCKVEIVLIVISVPCPVELATGTALPRRNKAGHGRKLLTINPSEPAKVQEAQVQHRRPCHVLRRTSCHFTARDSL